MKTTTRIIASAVAGVGIAAGAAAFAFGAGPPPSAPAPTADAGQRACFFSNQINGWRSDRSEKVAYLDVSVKDVYKAELFGRCHGLDDAITIGVETRAGGSHICDGLDVTLLVQSPIGPMRCQVTKLTKLTPEEVAALKGKKKGG